MMSSVLSLFSFRALEKLDLGDFGLLVIYRIVYFGVVFDLVFQICINSRTYVFSNSNRSLIEFMASRSGRSNLTCSPDGHLLINSYLNPFLTTDNLFF